MVMDCCTPYLKNIQFTHSSEIGHNMTCSMCEIEAKIWPIFFMHCLFLNLTDVDRHKKVVYAHIINWRFSFHGLLPKKKISDMKLMCMNEKCCMCNII